MKLEWKNTTQLPMSEVLDAVGRKSSSRNGHVEAVKAANELELDIVAVKLHSNGVRFFVSTEGAVKAVRKYEDGLASSAESKKHEKKPFDVDDELRADLTDIRYFLKSLSKSIDAIAHELNIELCGCGAKLAPEGVECKECGGRWES